MKQGGNWTFASQSSLQLMAAHEDASTAIARLDGRISVSSVAKPWRLRAAWSGYARALQLQGVEIDEIDIFSWGCGLPLRDRPRRTSHVDEFEGFGPWWGSLLLGDDGQWRDQLPFSPDIDRELPVLFRAIDLVHQYVLKAPSSQAWLALPRFLHRLGMTETPLPCLVGGAKAFRSAAAVPEDVLRSLLRALAASASRGIEMLDTLETSYRSAVRVITEEHRPAGLVRLLALSLSRPLLSPTQVAKDLDLTISGAGKLLERAAGLGMMVEISGRQAWKAYLTPELAVTFGFQKPTRGRPRRVPAAMPGDRGLAAAFDAFDREMAEIDRQLSKVGE